MLCFLMLYENFFIVKFAIAVPVKVKLVVEKKNASNIPTIWLGNLFLLLSHLCTII